MKTIALLLSLVTLVPQIALSAGLSPWQLGMSKSEVVSIKEFGPYKEFKNGDLETFNGMFYGQKENIQFFFDTKGLRRIGAYLYEGQNINDASSACQRAYDVLKKKFGEIETPDIKVSQESEPLDSGALAIAMAAHTDIIGKTQMAPRKQPAEMFVFSTFARQDFQGGRTYYVVVYFDRP